MLFKLLVLTFRLKSLIFRIEIWVQESVEGSVIHLEDKDDRIHVRHPAVVPARDLRLLLRRRVFHRKQETKMKKRTDIDTGTRNRNENIIIETEVEAEVQIDQESPNLS